jgi:hypothetical protein
MRSSRALEKWGVGLFDRVLPRRTFNYLRHNARLMQRSSAVATRQRQKVCS